MDLRRTPLLLEQQPVPVDWPSKVGYPPPGVMRKTSYPAGLGKSKEGVGIDDDYPNTPEGKKLAKAHAWLFPSKRIRSGKKVFRF